MTVDYQSPKVLKQIFPKLQTKPCRRRIRFLYHVSYINFWDELEDWEHCINTHKPDFERLFQNYLKTKLVPYFEPWIVSFVRYPGLFVQACMCSKPNKRDILIAAEDLLRHWQ